MWDERKPGWVEPRIKAAPKIRQVYWCDFWKDAMLPEFWKTRPVIVVSYKNTLHGPCLVVPTSTISQEENRWGHRLSVTFDGVQSWAVCNQPSTVSPSRFNQFGGRIPLLPEADFNAVLALLNQWLPRPFS
ncbi:MAG TPA: type II toxin-antitoxin system PemK/MazF family toxin [Rhizomicrobium sp.]|nr:type II toxin-antitoxin system PemK/MazF family toxin [Rhizomicrobium sp.]